MTPELQSYLQRYMPAHSSDLVGIASRWAEFPAHRANHARRRRSRPRVPARSRRRPSPAGSAVSKPPPPSSAMPSLEHELPAGCSRHRLPPARRAFDLPISAPAKKLSWPRRPLAHFRFCPLHPTAPSRRSLTSQVMKHLAILLLAFGLVSCAAGQALPDNPDPRLCPTPRGTVCRAWSTASRSSSTTPTDLRSTASSPE